MNQPAARQLYPQRILDTMSVDRLETVFRFAFDDAQPDNASAVYDGMGRTQTIMTAWRSCADIAFELRYRSDKGDRDAVAVLSRLAGHLTQVPPQ